MIYTRYGYRHILTICLLTQLKAVIFILVECHWIIKFMVKRRFFCLIIIQILELRHPKYLIGLFIFKKNGESSWIVHLLKHSVSFQPHLNSIYSRYVFCLFFFMDTLLGFLKYLKIRTAQVRWPTLAFGYNVYSSLTKLSHFVPACYQLIYA